MSAGCTEAQIRRRALQPLASVSCVWASPINRSLPPPHTIRSYSPQSHDYVQHFAWLAQKQSVQYSSLILLCYIGFILSFILREDKCLSSLNKNKQEDVTFFIFSLGRKHVLRYHQYTFYKSFFLIQSFFFLMYHRHLFPLQSLSLRCL